MTDLRQRIADVARLHEDCDVQSQGPGACVVPATGGRYYHLADALIAALDLRLVYRVAGLPPFVTGSDDGV